MKTKQQTKSSIWNSKRRYRQENLITAQIKLIINKKMTLNKNTKLALEITSLFLTLPIITGILMLIL